MRSIEGSCLRALGTTAPICCSEGNNRGYLEQGGALGAGGFDDFGAEFDGWVVVGHLRVVALHGYALYYYIRNKWEYDSRGYSSV